ncbi:hypothetical protein IX321_001603 [Bacteroides pyogenes]|nr:hypothetical protein [Bacteroides pyogenes]MBR8717572.1 hypothetical protein [Bacteroides pyogenes]MBR8747098.1 hypothetical protein [Bacteroides pyogenes]MBR8757442.1 hypothetical protein [Bacteroides pyogenes]MBR8780668.1 hypothetical protein [Bacteroides pyogenes]
MDIDISDSEKEKLFVCHASQAFSKKFIFALNNSAMAFDALLS